MLQMHIPMHILPEQPYRMQIMCNWIHVRPLNWQSVSKSAHSPTTPP
jgi:hypothetical protein